jgi:hypothetical protein
MGVMNPRTMFGLLAAVAVSTGIAVTVALWRQPAPVAPPVAAPPALNVTADAPGKDSAIFGVGGPGSAGMATVKATNKGGPCKLAIAGNGSFRGNFGSDLAAGESRMVMAVSAPFTIESLTVERAGKSRRQDVTLNVGSGEIREVVVNADDSVEVVPAGK